MKSIKSKLQKDELVLGTLISEIRNPNVTYMLAQCGFEFVIIDNEHGTYTFEKISDMVAAAKGADISAIVRIPEISRENILKPLDSGASGILVPMVNTADEAAQVVSFAKYPPMGNRGVALRRAQSSYARVDTVSYMEQVNRDTFIAVQCETTESLENVRAIASVDGVDCVFVGPLDLSVSLGIPGALDHPREVAAIETVISVCKEAGKQSGLLMFDAEMLSLWIRKGLRFAAYSSDIAMLADAAAATVAALKTTQFSKV